MFFPQNLGVENPKNPADKKDEKWRAGYVHGAQLLLFNCSSMTMKDWDGRLGWMKILFFKRNRDSLGLVGG